MLGFRSSAGPSVEVVEVVEGGGRLLEATTYLGARLTKLG